MRKIYFLTIGLFGSIVSFAQFSFGVQATGNLADARFSVTEGVSPDKKMKVFPGGGLIVNYAVNKNFSLRSGVNYLQQGVNLSLFTPSEGGDSPSEQLNSKVNLHYVQVPVTAVYMTSGKKLQFLGGAGGFVSYGMSGKIKSTIEYSSPFGHEVIRDNQDAFKTDADGNKGFKRWDAGVTAFAGVQMGKWFSHVGYQLSLTNLSQDATYSWRNRGLQLTVGYFLR